MGNALRPEIGSQLVRGASVQLLPWVIASSQPTTWLLLAAATQVLLGSDLIAAAGPRLRVVAVAALHVGALRHGLDDAVLVDAVTTIVQQGLASAAVFGLVLGLRRVRSCPKRTAWR
jgi:hypothetical protein